VEKAEKTAVQFWLHELSTKYLVKLIKLLKEKSKSSWIYMQRSTYDHEKMLLKKKEHCAEKLLKERFHYDDYNQSVACKRV